MIKLNLKNVILVGLAFITILLLVGCGNTASEYEMEIADKLEEKTGMEFEIYEMEMISGKECQANSFFQPDTGFEVYVYKYSDTYVEISVDFGKLGESDSDLEFVENVGIALKEIFGEENIVGGMPVFEMELDLGGF